MAKKKNHIPQKYQAWVEARRKYQLSHAHIQMARELGMNPRKFGSLANHKQEPWKLPLPEFIEHLYVKRFKKERPDQVRAIEEIVRAQQEKKEQRKQRVESL
jgi:hypothetical protein